jgi:hypothetical protein
MANHKNRSTCGKTYYTEMKDAPKDDKAPAKEAPKEKIENK